MFNKINDMKIFEESFKVVYNPNLNLIFREILNDRVVPYSQLTKLGIEEKFLIKYLDILEEKGYIKKKGFFGFNELNKYYVTKKGLLTDRILENV